MDYKKITLPNGLRVITVPMPSSESATLTVWAHVGSRFENQKVAGLSHFLEHMVFKGSKNRPTARDISLPMPSTAAVVALAVGRFLLPLNIICFRTSDIHASL